MFITLTITGTIDQAGGFVACILFGIPAIILTSVVIAEYRFLSKPEVIKLIKRGVPFDKLDETYKAERDQ